MISIVIPIYNKAHTISITLENVLSQTFRDFEVILVNDGSTDDILTILEEYTADSRFKIFNQDNQGVSVARNIGVMHAMYEHIAFLDGDDEWYPTYLEEMVVAIEKYPSAGLYCCAGVVRHANGTETLRIDERFENQTIEIDFFQNPGIYLHTSATIVKKSAYLKTSGFPAGMKRNQDFAFFFCLALVEQVIYCGKPLSIYNGGVQGQATETKTNKVIIHIVNRYNHVHQFWINQDKKNKGYLIYTKYELRHLIILSIRLNDFETIKYIYQNLNTDLLSYLLPYEKWMYTSHLLKLLSIGHILLTKIIWRLNGFPIVS